jgi:hypothetical protein
MLEQEIDAVLATLEADGARGDSDTKLLQSTTAVDSLIYHPSVPTPLNHSLLSAELSSALESCTVWTAALINALVGWSRYIRSHRGCSARGLDSQG